MRHYSGLLINSYAVPSVHIKLWSGPTLSNDCFHSTASSTQQLEGLASRLEIIMLQIFAIILFSLILLVLFSQLSATILKL